MSNNLIPSPQYTREIWFVHGANASPASFTHLKSSFEKDPSFNGCLLKDVTYDCQENLPAVIKVMADSAPKDRDLFIVGHSLGGVLAVATSQRIQHYSLPVKVKALVTLGAPFGGIESADYLRWLYPHYHLFSSVATQNKMILDLKATGAVVPTLSLVSTSGNNPLFPNSNDGVVTVNSQRSLPNADYIEMPYNHFEILLGPEPIDHCKRFIKDNF